MPDLNAVFRARTTFRDFNAGDVLDVRPGLSVATTALRHPGNATGYRLGWGQTNLCYVTDTEHPPEGLDENLAEFVAGSDLLIYDASYTDAEYQTRIGRGHSTWQAAARLADVAAVGRLVLFHHDPDHDDDAMDARFVHERGGEDGVLARRRCERLDDDRVAGNARARCDLRHLLG